MRWPRWLHVHRWNEFRVRVEDRSVWQCRECRCGRVEVWGEGPFGNRKWRDIYSPWESLDERGWFFRALGKYRAQERLSAHGQTKATMDPCKILTGGEAAGRRVIDLPRGVVRWKARLRPNDVARIFLTYGPNRSEVRFLEWVTLETMRPSDFIQAENLHGGS